MIHTPNNHSIPQHENQSWKLIIFLIQVKGKKLYNNNNNNNNNNNFHPFLLNFTPKPWNLILYIDLIDTNSLSNVLTSSLLRHLEAVG